MEAKRIEREFEGIRKPIHTGVVHPEWDKIPIQLDPYEMFKWVFKIVAWACYNMDDISGYENSDKYIRYKYIKYEVKFYDFK